MRLELQGSRDPLAIRLALVACRAPLRVERFGDRRAIVVDPHDAARARASFLRAGLSSRTTPAWPDVRAVAHGVLEAEGARWCLGRARVDDGPRAADAVLLLSPVSRDDVLRLLATRLGSRLRPFARRPRPLAYAAAAIARGDDGVVAARAYALSSGATERAALDALAAMRTTRLRAGALSAWSDIAAPRGGVWRSLAALEPWWT